MFYYWEAVTCLLTVCQPGLWQSSCCKTGRWHTHIISYDSFLAFGLSSSVLLRVIDANLCVQVRQRWTWKSDIHVDLAPHRQTFSSVLNWLNVQLTKWWRWRINVNYNMLNVTVRSQSYLLKSSSYSTSSSVETKFYVYILTVNDKQGTLE